MKRPPKILILGAKGLLGAELVDFLKRSKSYAVIGLNRTDADITEEKTLLRSFSCHKPDIIINCAALINVDYCETHPFEAWKTNTFGPGAILHTVRVLGLPTSIIHISSAYVFGNDRKRFREDDEAYPLNTYGVSKLMGERLARTEARVAGIPLCIIRTSWLYGQFRPTFVDTIAKSLREGIPFEAIADRRSVVTSTKNLAAGIEELINNEPRASGIYHLFDQSTGGVTRYEIALEIAKTLHLDPQLLKKAAVADILAVPCPTSAVLVNTKFRPFPHWRLSLQNYLREHYDK